MEHELITTDNFGNLCAPTRPGCTSLNPDFFTGTVVEEAVAKLVPSTLAAHVKSSYAT